MSICSYVAFIGLPTEYGVFWVLIPCYYTCVGSDPGSM